MPLAITRSTFITSMKSNYCLTYLICKLTLHTHTYCHKLPRDFFGLWQEKYHSYLVYSAVLSNKTWISCLLDLSFGNCPSSKDLRKAEDMFSTGMSKTGSQGFKETVSLLNGKDKKVFIECYSMPHNIFLI